MLVCLLALPCLALLKAEDETEVSLTCSGRCFQIQCIPSISFAQFISINSSGQIFSIAITPVSRTRVRQKKRGPGVRKLNDTSLYTQGADSDRRAQNKDESKIYTVRTIYQLDRQSATYSRTAINIPYK